MFPDRVLQNIVYYDNDLQVRRHFLNYYFVLYDMGSALDYNNIKLSIFGFTFDSTFFECNCVRISYYIGSLVLVKWI